MGHRGILIGRLNRVESWRCRERNRHKHAHMCAVYGNEIDVKGDQRKKGRLAKRSAKCTREQGPFDGPNDQLYPLTQTMLKELPTFLPSFFFQFFRLTLV